MPIPPRVSALVEQANSDTIRYIKLGKGNQWWPLAKESNTLRLGWRQFDFELCRNGNFDAAARDWMRLNPNLSPGTITSAKNQVREFFELPESTLWFTLADGYIWWCFAEKPVKNIYDGDDEKETRCGARLRCVVDRWRNTNVNDEPLRIDSTTTRITKTKSTQNTICKSEDGSEDLLRIIRCQPSETHQRLTGTFDNLVQQVGDQLVQLHQDEFELLVELIFSSSGWRRISSVGGNQEFLDIALILPTTGEKCLVQVKSKTNKRTFNEYVEELNHYAGYSRMFFAYHTPSDMFENPNPQVSVWNRNEIAKQTIRAGLVQWLLDRTT